MDIVRTSEGSAHFNKPIGSPLGAAPQPAPAPAPTSLVRLKALRAVILDKMHVGDEAAVRELTEKFRKEYQVFAKGKTPEQVEQALSTAA